MVAGYTALIDEVKKMKIDPSFLNVVNGMQQEVDEVMKEKLENAPHDQHQAIKDFGAACKKNIIPSLLLRTLCSALIDEFGPENETAPKEDGSETLKNKGVNVIQFTSQLIKQFNNEANEMPIKANKSNEKEQFPQFFALVEHYKTTKLNLTSGIANQALIQSVD